jgi:cell division protease FtsH
MSVLSAFLGSSSFQDWAVTWLPIIFMGAIVALLVWTLRLMPRTKPVQIRPQSKLAIGWREVAGVDEAKDELREVVEFLRYPDRFRAVGASVPKGILLHGPPGTGKTLLAKAVAHESGANYFAQSAASFVEMFAGLGAARIRRLFREARKHAPAIVFIDELDAVGGHRGMDVSGEKDQTLNQLLVELDGFDGRNDVVVIAASNLLEKLDPALLRPGRFDRQILVSPPGVDGRRKILDVHTHGKPLAPSVELDLVARQTSGLSGADLANICNEAAMICARRAGEQLSGRDFDGALERVVAGMQTRRRLNEHEKRVIAYHEAGHALCGELLASVDPVHKVSIVPRGQALGYTLNLPEEDRYLKTREELLEHMTMLLGGRAAERVVFGEVTTGAADDLRRVTDVAEAMVTDYAMGSSIQTLRTDGQHPSERLLRRRDEERQELTDEAFRRALEVMVAHRSELDGLAQGLLDREYLERDDIDRVMGHRARPRRFPRAGDINVAASSEPAPE